jgi:hypothetical protein
MSTKSVFVTGLAVGIGVKWLAPFFVPVLGALISPITRLEVKPLAKASVKAGWIGLERGRELFAYLGETVQDVLAEAREELVQADKPTVDRT